MAHYGNLLSRKSSIHCAIANGCFFSSLPQHFMFTQMRYENLTND